MGHTTSQEHLVLRWAELCADPRWDDIPGKIELNGLGVIEMSPATNRHGMQQAAISHALTVQLPAGTAIIECCVLTTDGVRVPDVAWASAAFMARHGDLSPFPHAPEICVEVRSPSNTDAEMAFKTELFLQAGAVEVWIVDEDGAQHVFNAQGARAGSQFGVVLA
jgi:Uma2 family endonuclease